MRGERGVYAAEGVYREIVHGARLVLTWLWTEAPEGEQPVAAESLVTFELRPDGDGTLLTLTHEGLADQEAAESYSEGWGEELDKLAMLMGGRPRPKTLG